MYHNTYINIDIVLHGIIYVKIWIAVNKKEIEREN